MKSVEEITTAIRGKERIGYTTSTYTMVNETLVRVSNHLPKAQNLIENNDGVKKVFLILAETNLTEREIESYIESELEQYFEVEYLLIDESFDFTIEQIFNMIEQF